MFFFITTERGHNMFCSLADKASNEFSKTYSHLDNTAALLLVIQAMKRHKIIYVSKKDWQSGKLAKEKDVSLVRCLGCLGYTSLLEL